MNELKRMAYLEAMGTDAYISRSQLPGAALTHRLAIVRGQPLAPPATPPGQGTGAGVDSKRPSASKPELPRIEIGQPSPGPAVAVTPVTSARAESVPAFSLAAVLTGDLLWLEELRGSPMSMEQLKLIQAMAYALGTLDSPTDGPGPDLLVPEVSQFNWPLHTNQQLDLGPEAARSGVAGFIRRKLEQQDCRCLVLLGAACGSRVPLAELDCPRVAQTVSSAEMLGNPLLKKQAWNDLRSLFPPA